MAAGHGVTTYNRGRTNPDLFPAIRSLHGDRATGDYGALEGAAVDMCAYVPGRKR